MNDPKLLVAEPGGAVRGIAVVLHGGREHSRGQVRPTQLAVLRMRPFVASLRRAGHEDGLAVAQVRYRVRGWNTLDQSPVADAEWALEQLGDRYPGAPLALVGHSMGGRTALYVAGHENVRCVVALAPWIERVDPVRPLAGRRVLMVHGDRDRMTSPKASASYARAAAQVAASVSFVTVTGERHAMLRRAPLWHELTTGFVRAVLFDCAPPGTGPDEISKILAQALAGQAALVV